MFFNWWSRFYQQSTPWAVYRVHCLFHDFHHMWATFSHLVHIIADNVVLRIVSQNEHFTSCLSCLSNWKWILWNDKKQVNTHNIHSASYQDSGQPVLESMVCSDISPPRVSIVRSKSVNYSLKSTINMMTTTGPSRFITCWTVRFVAHFKEYWWI